MKRLKTRSPRILALAAAAVSGAVTASDPPRGEVTPRPATCTCQEILESRKARNGTHSAEEDLLSRVSTDKHICGKKD